MQATAILDGVICTYNVTPNPSVSTIVPCENHKTSIRSAFWPPRATQGHKNLMRSWS